MRIQHNIAALNSHRNMGVNNASTSKNLEKLSSGFRINRAGDDAAGLAISEKMRGQIRGLAMAEQNTSNAISLIQTAEGGLNETHAILQRMRELAVQSSNGTYDGDVDRANLDLEFQAIKDEIDRISTSTHYNGIKLLDGSLGKNDSIPTAVGVRADGAQIPMSTVNAGAWSQAAASTAGGANFLAASGADAFTVEVAFRDLDGNIQSQSFSVAGDTSYANQMTALDTQLNEYFGDYGVKFAASAVAAGGVTLGAISQTGDPGDIKFELAQVKLTNDTAGTTATANAGAVTPGTNAGNEVTLTGAKFLEVDGKKFQFVSDPAQLEQGAEAIFVDADMLTNGELSAPDADTLTGILAQLKDKGFTVKQGTNATDVLFEAGSGKGLTFQIGANGGEDQRVQLSVNAMDSKSIGLQDANAKLTKSLASTDILTIEGANAAIDVITGATNMVSAQRAGLGALQNRLEHTMNNLGVTKENLTSAESVIRDVDMAKEMMEFTKNQILVQSSQAMLAQANQLPQGVLSLLR